LTDGSHTLELAAFIVENGVLESERSAALQLNKVTVASAPANPAAAPWPGSMLVTTADGLRLRLDRFAADVVRPVDMAFAPDGRLFVAEEAGNVRVLLPDGRVAADAARPVDAGAPGARLVAFALDPQFDRTRVAYVLSVVSREGAPSFRLVRVREASNALIAPAVVLEAPAPSPGAAGSVRIGGDGKLYVALGGVDGRILRLNPDGTTPDDQPGLNPLYTSPVRSPRGFEWQPGSSFLWFADQLSEDAAAISAVGAPAGRPVRLASFLLPRGTAPSSVAFYRHDLMPRLRDDLLIASESGRHLLRIRFDARDRTRVTATERLLRNTIGGLRAIAVGREGRVYLATQDAIATLSPADG
jgi:glucose/arabinose dehydrogenase